MKRVPFLSAIIFCLVTTGYAQKQPNQAPMETIPVGDVWSGHSVGFDLLTSARFQYVGYYDENQNMVVAQRALDSKQWKKTILPTKVGWDSHNYIEMALDRDGYLHVSGNMHAVPLIYFRSERPENIDRFEKLPMTHQNEDRVTYPIFLKSKQGQLYYQYRNGGSGNGSTYYNKYDPDTKTWSRLFDTPFFDGEEEASAYMTTPRLAPDEYFYIMWMWRLTPVANTCHNLSVVRSRDLLAWETMSGTPIELPIQWRNTAPIAVPVGPWNGLVNMSYSIRWDRQNRPCLTYHQYDSDGISQIFITRWEPAEGKGQWRTYQVSQWPDFTWELNLRGSLKRSISISELKMLENNEIALSYTHEKYGTGTWVLDESTLKVKREIANEPTTEPVLPPVKLREGLETRTKADNTGRYVLRWQTLPVNQDRPQPDKAPAPSQLVVYDLGTK